MIQFTDLGQFDEVLGYQPVFRQNLGDGFGLVGFYSITRRSASIGLEVREGQEFPNRDEYRRLVRAKMQVLGDRLMDAWDKAHAREER